MELGIENGRVEINGVRHDGVEGWRELPYN